MTKLKPICIVRLCEFKCVRDVFCLLHWTELTPGQRVELQSGVRGNERDMLRRKFAEEVYTRTKENSTIDDLEVAKMLPLPAYLDNVIRRVARVREVFTIEDVYTQINNDNLVGNATVLRSATLAAFRRAGQAKVIEQCGAQRATLGPAHGRLIYRWRRYNGN